MPLKETPLSNYNAYETREALLPSYCKRFTLPAFTAADACPSSASRIFVILAYTPYQALYTISEPPGSSSLPRYMRCWKPYISIQDLLITFGSV